MLFMPPTPLSSPRAPLPSARNISRFSKRKRLPSLSLSLSRLVLARFTVDPGQGENVYYRRPRPRTGSFVTSADSSASITGPLLGQDREKRAEYSRNVGVLSTTIRQVSLTKGDIFFSFRNMLRYEERENDA